MIAGLFMLILAGQTLASLPIRAVRGMWQALLGLFAASADPAAQRVPSAIALLLVSSVFCLGVGLVTWQTHIAWAGAWLVWLAGAAGLGVAGVLGSLHDARRP